jgi:hypothetical protein
MEIWNREKLSQGVKGTQGRKAQKIRWRAKPEFRKLMKRIR